MKEPAFNTVVYITFEFADQHYMSLNSKVIVLTHMKSCLESMQAFEKFSTHKPILSLKVENMFSGEERCSNQTNLLLCWLPCYNIMVSKQPLSDFFFKLSFDLSKLIQTYSQRVCSKGFLAKQSCIIVWCANFRITNI